MAQELALGAVAGGVNRHFQLFRSWKALYGPQSPDLVTARTRAQLESATASQSVGRPMARRGTLLSLRIPPTTSHLDVLGSYVYLPPQYRYAGNANVRFPVVEAFNGSPGRPADWLNGISADSQLDKAMGSGALPPAIVVFAPTNTSVFRSLECADSADGKRDETYLTRDVRDWVVGHLRTASTRWTAFGYSTGGYCALDLAVRHPDLFRAAVSLDGYGRALQDHYARGLWRDDAERLAHSPDWLLLHRQPQPVDFYLAAGDRDHEAASDAVRTWRALAEGGWWRPTDRLAVERGGHHTFPDWAHALVPALRWALGASSGVPQAGDVLARLHTSARPLPCLASARQHSRACVRPAHASMLPGSPTAFPSPDRAPLDGG